MVIIDNKVANKPHIYFNREKGGWRLQPTYGFNGDHHVVMKFNLEAYLFVCILHCNHAEYEREMCRYKYRKGKQLQIRNTWRVKK